MLSWGFNFVAIKILYLGMAPASLALSRFLVMYLAMVPICLFAKDSLKYPHWKETGPLLLIGALSMGVYMVLFLEGARQTTPGEAAILIATSPIWTLLLEVVFKLDRFRWSSLIGAVISVVGVALVIGPIQTGRETTWLGIALLALSALCWALSVVLSKIHGAGRSPLQLITLSMPGALIVLIPYGLMPMLNTSWVSLTGNQWLLFMHVALMAGAVGFFGFFTGVKQVGASGAMRYQFFVPPFAMLSAYLVLGQAVTPWQLVGVPVVLLGVWYASWARKEPLPVIG